MAKLSYDRTSEERQIGLRINQVGEFGFKVDQLLFGQVINLQPGVAAVNSN